MHAGRRPADGGGGCWCSLWVKALDGQTCIQHNKSMQQHCPSVKHRRVWLWTATSAEQTSIQPVCCQLGWAPAVVPSSLLAAP
jgi:hypothetical protein